MKVVFSDRAYAAVLAETTEKIKTETGGLFLGAFRDDTWYVIEAIDPGPKSIFEVAYFEYDQKYTQHLINKIANLYSEKLLLIGLWHRHPGSFDQFSSTDDGTNSKYARLSQAGAISALVNIDPKFRLTMFHVGSPCKYTRIRYEVGNHLIPEEMLKLKSPERFEHLMERVLHPSDNHDHKYHLSVSLASFMKFILPNVSNEKCIEVETNNMLSDKEAKDKLVNELVDDITYLSDERGIEFSIQQNDQYISLVQEAFDRTVRIHFMYSIPKESVIFSYDDECYLYRAGLFRETYEKSYKQQKQYEQQMQQAKNDKNANIFESVFRIIGHSLNGDE